VRKLPLPYEKLNKIAMNTSQMMDSTPSTKAFKTFLPYKLSFLMLASMIYKIAPIKIIE